MRITGLSSRTLRTYHSLSLILSNTFPFQWNNSRYFWSHYFICVTLQIRFSQKKSFVLRYKSHLLCIRVNFHSQASKFISLVPNWDFMYLSWTFLLWRKSSMLQNALIWWRIIFCVLFYVEGFALYLTKWWELQEQAFVRMLRWL